MIVTLILDVLVGALATVIGLLPAFEEPAWTSGIASNAIAVGEYAAGFSNWFPFSALVAVILTVGLVYGLVVSARLVLWTYAHLPFVGKGS